MPFKPGQSGNPAGKPKGAKNKLTEAFWRDFAEAWKARGRAALEEVANKDPATFIRVAASLMPKELDIAGNVQHILADRPVLIEDWKRKYAEVPGEKTH